MNTTIPSIRGTALVTGASIGIGEAIVRRLVADGWRVIATARRADKLQALAAELAPAVLPLALDVTDRAAVAALPQALPADWAAVDLLVNNAGLALGREPAHQASLDDWQTMVDANVTGLRIAPAGVMVASGSGGDPLFTVRFRVRLR